MSDPKCPLCGSLRNATDEWCGGNRCLNALNLYMAGKIQSAAPPYDGSGDAAARRGGRTMSTTEAREPEGPATDNDDLRHLVGLVSELVEWKHAAGPLCPERVGRAIFRLSVVCLRLSAGGARSAPW